MPRIDGETLRTWRRSHGWDVPKMAQELRQAAGDEPMPAHDSLVRQIRGWERGDHEISERHELLYLKALGSPLTVQDTPQGEDDPVRRHEFLVMAGAATANAIAGAVIGPADDRHVARRGTVDETSVLALTTITGAQRKLEATTPARDLASSALAHAGTAHRMLLRAGDSSSATGIAGALSEACGLAAWLHADMADAGSARSCYRAAVQAARSARSGLLTGYMLGSLASFESDSGIASRGSALIEQARRQIGRPDHPTPLVWLLAVQSLTLAATAGNGDAAWRTLGEAEQVLARSDDAGPPPWPWVFSFDYPKLASYRAQVAVRIGRPADALAAFAEAAPGASPAPKQRAIVTLEVAAATCQQGSEARDTAMTDHAFAMASDALSAGVTYASDRVLERSWRFRRSYTGPLTSQVRDFDEQLRTAA